MPIAERINIIGVPSGLGGRRKGASLGPAAIRIARLQESLLKVAKQVIDGGDLVSSQTSLFSPRGEGLHHFDSLLGIFTRVREAVYGAVGKGTVPLVLGGDHSLAFGTVSGALEQLDSMGVLWIDAHGDYNTPDTSPSGNLHGMPLAGLCRFPYEGTDEVVAGQWQRLLDEMVPTRPLDPNHIVWIGIRELDPGEIDRMRTHGLHRVITMHEIDRFGMQEMVQSAFQTLEKAGVKWLWVSFDVDVLDPAIAPGTGTDVRGGLRYREAHLLAELLAEALGSEKSPLRLAGIEVVEVNPTLDRTNETAEMAVDWLMSVMGKRILPRWA